MSRRNARIREGVIIDLTSLLDVIFILLLVVMCGQRLVAAQMGGALDEQVQAAAAFEEMTELYWTQLESMESVFDTVSFVSVTVPYDRENVTRRKICLLVEPGTEMKEFPLIGNNVSGSLEECKKYLSDYLAGHGAHPVILSLNEEDENILYRDERAMKELLDDLVQNFGNAYIAQGQIGEDQ